MNTNRSVLVVVMLAILATLGLAAVATGQAREDVGVVAPPWNGPFPPAGTNWKPDALLYDNGPLITHPGGCTGTYVDASRLQGSLGMTTYGVGNQIATPNYVADDFTVPAAGWHIDTITFYGYQTGATTPTINDVRVQIWNNAPNAGGSIVWGDLTTNRLAGSATIGTWQRDWDSGTCANNRLVQVIVATINTNLAAGTYWVQWAVGGTGASGPWAPPITIIGQTTTGNALQYTTSSGAWAAANDTGSATQQGFPFTIDGTVLPVELQKLTIE
jgi:hypothetical protein